MKKLRVSFVAGDSARDKVLANRIGKTLRAAVVGKNAYVIPVAGDDAHELEIVISGESRDTGIVSLDFSGKPRNGSFNLAKQPVLLDFAVAGVETPKFVSQKINKLDSNDYTWAVIRGDDVAPPLGVPEDKIYTESQIFENPLLLENVSHAFLVTDNGPLMCQKLVGYHGALLFYVGGESSLIDTSSCVVCSSVQDGLTKAKAISASPGGSSKAFKNQVVPKVFSQRVAIARDARALVGSALRVATKSDYGFLDTSLGDKRLLELVTGIYA